MTESSPRAFPPSDRASCSIVGDPKSISIDWNMATADMYPGGVFTLRWADVHGFCASLSMNAEAAGRLVGLLEPWANMAHVAGDRPERR
jgi:hypothetical protein